MLTAINTETGVVRWVVKMPHPVTSLELNKRHQSLVEALQPPYAVVHYRGIKAQEPPELAPWLQQARVVGIGGQGMTRHDFALLPAAGAAAAPARRAVTERLPGPVRRTPQPLLGADPGRECAGSASDCVHPRGGSACAVARLFLWSQLRGPCSHGQLLIPGLPLSRSTGDRR